MTLLGVDVGTTSCKAGIFSRDGSPLKTAARPTATRRMGQGHPYYDPEELWESVASAIREAVADSADVLAIGVASMAEAGLLVDRRTGAPRSHIIPWFDPRSRQQSEELTRAADPVERFRATGIRPSFKCGLSKLLWLQRNDPDSLVDATWLSTADYIVHKLTGRMATDPSLAARTYAFRITDGSWDEGWIRHLGLDPEIFPEVLPAGTPVGEIRGEAAKLVGLSGGIPVAIAGHDHVCAAVGAGATQPGQAVDSIGTAESLLGVMGSLSLGEREYGAGLSYGMHVLRDRYFWLGGLSAAGGSIEWWRSQIADEPLSYERIEDLLARAAPGPTGILYYPYLSGSGAPHPDSSARAAFIGLQASHDRSHLLKAVLEGTAYEIESIRRSAKSITGCRLDEIVAVGGGTRNRRWMQVRADVSGCRYRVPALAEATLLGAALVVGIGTGAYPDEREALTAVGGQDVEVVMPDAQHHRAYRNIYECGYLPLQQPLRRYYEKMGRREDG